MPIIRQWRSCYAILVFVSSLSNLYITRGLISTKSSYSNNVRLCRTCLNKFQTLDSIASELVVPGNTTATLLNLISLGDHWTADKHEPQLIGFGSSKTIPPHWEKVPGCMADARIHTSITSQESSMNPSDPVVALEGIADSRVALGMVAMLCTGMSNLHASQVIAINPENIAVHLGLGALPPGRLNGLRNMVTIIQQQTRAILAAASATSTTSNPTLPAQTISTPSPAAITLQASNTLTGPAVDPRGDEVAVLLSGGVDSSVALHLLQQSGHRVRAFYLKIWLEDEVAHLNECPWQVDTSHTAITAPHPHPNPLPAP